MISFLTPWCAGTYEGAPQQWTNDAGDVHVFLSLLNGIHTLAWEGTTDFREWLVDFTALQVPAHDHPELGPVHLGFLSNVTSVLMPIVKYLDSIGWPPFDNTGHSKGGECLIFHGLLKGIGHAPRRTVVFESPRVGGPKMRDYLAQDDIAQTRTYNSSGPDLVTEVPFDHDEWVDMREPMILDVPDSYGIPQKHKIPAVIEALSK